MARLDIGAEIVSDAIRNGTHAYRQLGIDLDFTDRSKLDHTYAHIFGDYRVDQYRWVLQYEDRHGLPPTREMFETEYAPGNVMTDIPWDSEHTTEELTDYALRTLRWAVLHEASPIDYLYSYNETTKSRDVPTNGDDALDAAEAHLVAYLEKLQKLRYGASGLTVESMAGVVPEQTRWLWENRLPLGSLSVTAGKPGIGKSQFAAWLSAQVTRGTLPGDLSAPKNVLYVYIEDSLSKTLVPRLMAADADMDRMFRFALKQDPDKTHLPSLASDLEQIELIIRQKEIALVIFDPIVSVVQVDRNKSDEIRPMLQKLAEVAERTNCVIHGLMHFRKQAAEDALTMIGGSGDWGAIIRAALGFVRDNESPDLRTVVSQIKNNLGPMGLESKTFTIQTAQVQGSHEFVITSKLVWGEDSAWSAEEIMSGRNTEKAQSSLDACAEWLREMLSDGPLEKQVIVFQGQTEGYSVRTIERAKRTLPIRNHRQGGSNGTTTWELINDDESEAA